MRPNTMALSADTSPASCAAGSFRHLSGSRRITCSSWSGRRSSHCCITSRPWNASRPCSQRASHSETRKVNNMKEAVIVSGARTAVGRAPRGTLRATYPDDMAGAAIKEVLRRAPGLDPAEVEDVIIGCAIPEGTQGLNIARQAAARAGLPEIVPLEVESSWVDDDGQPQQQKTVFKRDEGPRRDTSEEGLARLRPAFQAGGTITAGNSSQRSDGAAAVVVMERERAEQLGLKP